MDKVSIYIPTYNRRILLGRAIASVLSQSYKNIELIVVDDFSSDGTFEYMQQLLATDNRIVYLRNDENRGACFNRNRAIAAAKGRFITGLDDDDYFLPDRISAFIDYWDEDKHLALYSNVITLELEGSRHVDFPKQSDFHSLCVKNTIGNQIFMKRDTMLLIGGFDENLKCWQDLDMWLNLSSKKLFGTISNILKSNYVFDKSHEHERISKGKVEKYLISADYISKKYNLKGRQRYRIFTQAYMYEPKSIPIKNLFLYAIRSMSFYVFLRMIKYRFVSNRGM